MKSGFTIFKAGKRLIKGKQAVVCGFLLIMLAIYIGVISLEVIVKGMIFAPQGQGINMAEYSVTAAAALLMFLLYAPLRLGRRLWYMKNAAASDNSAMVIFHFFGRRYFKCLLLQTLKALWILVLFAAFFSPVIAGYLCWYFGLIPISYQLMLSIMISLSVALSVPFAATASLYWQTGYIFAIYPDMPILKIFSTSRRVMKNKRLALMGLIIRCMPLMCSCLLILPCVYAVPVIQSGFAEFAYDATL